MQESQVQGYVSVIGSSYLHPISKLLESLEKLSPKEPNQVHTSDLDNGYSVSIIVLTVLLIESTLNRTQYIKRKKFEEPIEKGRNSFKPIEFLKKEFTGNPIVEEIEEIFVLRDTIVHNHLWEANVYWDKESKLRLNNAQIINDFGDTKYKTVKNTETRMTNKLHLNLFPTRICRGDCIITLKKAVELLLLIENIDRNYCYISAQYVEYKNSPILFVDIIHGLQY
jgi:hypothetical protein